jgi:hypothetical protein
VVWVAAGRGKSPRGECGLRWRIALNQTRIVKPSGRLAQLGERLPYKQEVGGSIPSPPIASEAASRPYVAELLPVCTPVQPRRARCMIPTVAAVLGIWQRRQRMAALILRAAGLAVGALVAAASAPTAAAPSLAACSWKTFRIPVSSDPKHPAGLATVAAVSAKDAWASGFRTKPINGERMALILHWNGSRWRAVPTPDPAHNGIASIAAIGGDAWAVGRNGRGAVTLHWSGKKWLVVPNPGGPGSSLTEVAMASRNDVWAIGVSRAGPLALHRQDSKWSKVAGPDFGQGGDYSAVAVVPGTSEVWIYGSDGRSAGVSAALWTGLRWEKFALPVKGAGWSIGPRSITAESPSSAWIAMTVDDAGGRSRPFMLHWNGSAWAQAPVPNPSDSAFLVSVAARTDSEAWALGRYLTSGPRMLHSFVLRWDGVKWSLVGSPRHTGLVGAGPRPLPSGVAAVPGTHQIWVVGPTLDEYSC